jgi:hypothetical protein
MPFLANNSERWFNRAETVRAIASQVNDPEAKSIMLSIANGYERLARYSKASVMPRQDLTGKRPDAITHKMRL